MHVSSTGCVSGQDAMIWFLLRERAQLLNVASPDPAIVPRPPATSATTTTTTSTTTDPSTATAARVESLPPKSDNNFATPAGESNIEGWAGPRLDMSLSPTPAIRGLSSSSNPTARGLKAQGVPTGEISDYNVAGGSTSRSASWEDLQSSTAREINVLSSQLCIGILLFFVVFLNFFNCIYVLLL
jgi:hypothetical protein